MDTTAETSPSGKTRRCAVLGSPISHSLSPVIHEAAYAYLGLDWHYTAHEVAEHHLTDFIATLDQSWRGLSLTMPLKKDAVRVATTCSDLVTTIGVANTLIRENDGWFADNTDVSGIGDTLRDHGVQQPHEVCIWGAGATATSVVAALASNGASAQIHLHARSAERARSVVSAGQKFGQEIEVHDWSVGTDCRAADVTVATTPAGVLDDLAGELSQAVAGRLLFDVVYDPWPTVLATMWQQTGGVVASGLDFLVRQAVGQVRLMTGHDVPVEPLQQAALEALKLRAQA